MTDYTDADLAALFTADEKAAIRLSAASGRGRSEGLSRDAALAIAEERADAAGYDVGRGTLRRVVNTVRGNPEASLPKERRSGERPEPADEDVGGEVPVGGGEYNALKWVSDHDYLYSEEADSYEVYLGAARSKMEIPGKAIRDLREWYCGQKMTQNQCAQRLGMPRSWLIELLRVFGITKDDLPLTDEEVKDGTVEVLSARALMAKKRVVQKKMEERERRHETRDALRWRTWEHEANRQAEEFLAALGDRAGSAADYVVPRVTQDADKPVRGLVCNHQDLHLGVRAVGSPVTLAEQAESRMRGFRTIIEKATRYARLDRLVLDMLPDAGHTDGNGSTTSGTQVESNASDGEIDCAVYDLALDMINLARRYCPVTFVRDRGNHNDGKARFASHALTRHFATADDVTFTAPRGPLNLVVYGDHLLVFLHGDVPRKRLDKIGNVLLAYARDLLGTTKYITVHTGHLHFEAVWDDGGLVRRQTPAVPETDAYHTDNLYVGSRKLMQGVLLNPFGYDDDTLSGSLESALAPAL